MLKLSVLIPVYNAEEYIGKLLDCILRQVDDRTEIILLNDGSRDRSEKICVDYEAKYPKKIRFISRENKGAVYTRRELFRAATGEWIWVIDSDDMLPNDALAIIADAISDESLCDMVLFDYYSDLDGKKSIVHQLPYEDGAFFEGKEKKVLYKEITCGYRINALWNKVFKRRCIDFDVDYSEYEDVKKANDCLQLIPILTNAQRVIYKRFPVYIYNMNNSNSLSHVFQDYTYTSLLKVYQRKKEYIYKWKMWDEIHEDFYIHESKRAIDLLKKYARSDKTKQEYYGFFDRIMNDGEFSEAVDKCNCSDYSISDRVFISLIKKKKKRLSYILISMG